MVDRRQRKDLAIRLVPHIGPRGPITHTGGDEARSAMTLCRTVTTFDLRLCAATTHLWPWSLPLPTEGEVRARCACTMYTTRRLRRGSVRRSASGPRQLGAYNWEGRGRVCAIFVLVFVAFSSLPDRDACPAASRRALSLVLLRAGPHFAVLDSLTGQRFVARAFWPVKYGSFPSSDDLPLSRLHHTTPERATAVLILSVVLL